MQDNLGAAETNSSDFRPTETLRVLSTFAPAPGGGCPVSVATLATLAYQLETAPESNARGVLLAHHASEGTACLGNDAEDTAAKALSTALMGLNRDSILSLFKDLQ